MVNLPQVITGRGKKHAEMEERQQKSKTTPCLARITKVFSWISVGATLLVAFAAIVSKLRAKTSKVARRLTSITLAEIWY
jgi:cell division protein FtsL